MGDLSAGAAIVGGVVEAGAACVMVIVVPVMVTAAVRAAPVLGATANCTVPLPLPEAL